MFEGRELDLAYAAGLMDGEGSFSIQIQIKNYKGRESVNFCPRITCNMKNSLVVQELLVSLFGGRITQRKVFDGMNHWTIASREDVTRAATALLPYLRLKRGIAERFLEALSYYPTERAQHNAGRRSWDLATTIKVAEIALSLNPATARRSKYGMEYLERLKKIYENDPDASLPSAPKGPPKGARRVKDETTGKWKFLPPELADWSEASREDSA